MYRNKQSLTTILPTAADIQNIFFAVRRPLEKSENLTMIQFIWIEKNSRHSYGIEISIVNCKHTQKTQIQFKTYSENFKLGKIQDRANLGI